MRVGVRACVRARVRVCKRACARECVCVCVYVRACVRACMPVRLHAFVYYEYYCVLDMLFCMSLPELTTGKEP